MPRRPYEWDLGSQVPTIEAHSLAKHEVLKQYLLKYIEILTSDLRIPQFKLALVDGFAGGGLYRRYDDGQIHEGSPFILLKTAAEAAKIAQIRRSKSFRFDTRFFFIESSPSVFSFLEESLRQQGFDPSHDSRVTLWRGDFESKLPDILKAIKTKSGTWRTIFLLDQYGYVDAPISSLQSIFTSVPKAEVILTFAMDWLIDYTSQKNDNRVAMSRLGISEADQSAILELRSTTSEESHFEIQRRLCESLVKRSGALFYTPFFIRSPKASKSYWLIHLSGHARARDAMATLHWSIRNTFQHFGSAGLNMLGYDPNKEELRSGQQVFLFDDDARSLTIESVREDACQRLYHNSKGERFIDLFADTCNGSPANQEIMQEALELAVRAGDLVVKNGDKERREGVVIKNDDIIVPHPRPRLFLDDGGVGRWAQTNSPKDDPKSPL